VKERLRLVTDFAELRAGVLVVVKPCSYCGKAHRSILTRFNPEVFGFTPCGDSSVQPAWMSEPQPECERNSRRWITPGAVECRLVYRVEDGLEDTQTTSTSTPAPSRKKARA